MARSIAVTCGLNSLTIHLGDVLAVLGFGR